MDRENRGFAAAAGLYLRSLGKQTAEVKETEEA